MTFSPDGSMLATASDDGTARTWDTATGLERGKVKLLDFAGADLRDADLTGARLVRCRLADAKLAGSRWSRSAVAGVGTADDLPAVPELAVAGVVGRDAADVMLSPGGPATCLAMSPTDAIMAGGFGNAIETCEIAAGRGRARRYRRAGAPRAMIWRAAPGPGRPSARVEMS